MKYFLSSDMADRIRFDEMVKRLALDDVDNILTMKKEEIEDVINNIDEQASSAYMIYSETWETDDEDEAEARFFSIYPKILKEDLQRILKEKKGNL
ncbi:MAG: hypothetical protein ABIN05_07880 [candidate division WOR-3 bacterium]